MTCARGIMNVLRAESSPHFLTLICEEKMTEPSRFTPHHTCPVCQSNRIVGLTNSKKKFICCGCEAILTWKGILPNKVALYREDNLTVIQINSRSFVWSTTGILKRKQPSYYIVWTTNGSHITRPYRPVR